jgi:putative CocE/NonD family hydrolase
MIGASYLGWAQWFAVSKRPPHLTTIIPNVSPPDPFHNSPYDHGVLWLTGSILGINLFETNVTGDLNGDPMAEAEHTNFLESLKSLPVIDLYKIVFGRESDSWRHWASHSSVDDYWAPLMFPDTFSQSTVPVFHQSGWFDGDGIGTKLNYLGLAHYGKAIQKLTIGPWAHTDTGERWSLGQDFGPVAAVDLQGDYLRWFDHWLKGVDNGIDREPLVSLFVMGSNRWIRGQKYPLPETHFEKLYLDSRGHANTSRGDGWLSFSPPDDKQAPDHYTYDPGNPTPEPGLGGPASRERVTAAREDILVYTSHPLKKPSTIAGPIEAILYASSSARDTDWFVHLLDVDPAGNCSPLWNNSSGQLRARYRNSIRTPELLDPGRVYQFRIDLWQTAITIPEGHRLRVEVASAAFPVFSRNLNTGGNNEEERAFVVANQTIYHDIAHASYLLIPTIP